MEPGIPALEEQSLSHWITKNAPFGEFLRILSIILSIHLFKNINKILLYAWHSFFFFLVGSVMSDSVRPHRRQPTRFPRPWDSPGKNTAQF